MELTAGAYSLAAVIPEICFGRPIVAVVQLAISSAFKSAAIVFGR